LVFLAELGDKTQLVALLLATRFKAGVVLAGVAVATLLVHAFSVVLGDLAGKLLPHGWIMVLAGLAFIAFAIWTWRGDKLEDDDPPARRLTSPFLIVTVTFFLAELGDKTMLSTVTLASQYSPVQVWLGSSLGMVLSDALAIWVGQVMGTRLPEKAVKLGAALIFLAFGLFSIFQGVTELLQTCRVAVG
jgi:putative Ca2+/H+ antiporter (TMEM165/GDT1 family)